MSIRIAALQIVDLGRRLLGPDAFDLRPTTIRIVRRSYTGGAVGRRDPVDEEVCSLPPYIKVRHLSTREIAGSGGKFEEGDVIVGPITPQFPRPDGTLGGFTEEQLNPKVRPGSGEEILYQLRPEDGQASGIHGDYRLIEFKRDRSLRFMLGLGRLRTTP